MFAIIIPTVGITSIVLFANVNTIRIPSSKILDKATYQKILKDQNLEKSPTIDYYSLANSNYTILDLVTGNTNVDYCFFFFGSDAYPSTAKALYGWEEPVPNSTYIDPVNYETSLMLNLYDLFFNDANKQKLEDYGVANINPVFYNYVDISFNKNTLEGDRLLNKRAYSMPGSFYPNGSKEPVLGTSNVWKVGNDIANPRYENVVSTTTYNYEPTNDYYEFRPNDGTDTKTEKVYFRDQDVVRNYQKISTFLTNFGNKNNFTFNNTGTLLVIKKDGNDVSYLALTDFALSINKLLVQIIKFFNPDSPISDDEEIVPGNGEDSGNNQEGEGSTTNEPTTFESYKPKSFINSTHIMTDYSYTIVNENYYTIANLIDNDEVLVANRNQY